jgi:hypothetical protein
MDFIIKLLLLKDPMTKVEYNSILVIMDRLTKYVHILSYIEVSNAINLAYTFLQHIIANHKTLESIISNRDKLFTFKF